MYRKETVNRWVVEKHIELDAASKAEYRINGIDPDNHWTLQCSFQTKDAAITQCDELSEIHATVCGIFDNYQTQTYRVRDIGKKMTFEVQGGLF